MQKINVAIERPAPWLSSPIDGQRHRQFFANLMLAITECDLSFDMADIPFGGDFAPRVAPPGKVLLSYHSVGAAPNVWRLKESYVAPYYYFDRTGYSGWAQIANDPELAQAMDGVPQAEADAFVAALRDRLTRHNDSKYRQGSEAAPEPGYVFFPLQMADDSVARLSRVGLFSLLAALTREAKRSGVRLVVKRHPLCRSQAMSELLRSAAQDGVVVSNASVHALIGGARAVVTVNSGVGFEALIHGKPVFTAGHCDYQAVTQPLHSESQVAQCLGSVPWDTARAHRFVAFYLNHYCVDASNVEALKQRIAQAVKEAETSSRPTAADDYVHLESVRYFAELERQRRDKVGAALQHALGGAEPRAQPRQADAAASAELAQAQEKLMQTNAECYALITTLYERLASPARSLEALAAVNRGGKASRQAFSPEYYQKLHDKDSAFQQNNWLVPYLAVFTGAGVQTLREIGCGNGAFLDAASPHIPLVIGVDWARSPLLPQKPGIEFQQADITKVDLPEVDVNCSADVLEHLPFEALNDTLARLHRSATVNFHVIACYDDGHSHLSIFHPDEWLHMFRRLDQRYHIFDLTVRHGDVNKVVCVITNWCVPQD